MSEKNEGHLINTLIDLNEFTYALEIIDALNISKNIIIYSTLMKGMMKKRYIKGAFELFN